MRRRVEQAICISAALAHDRCFPDCPIVVTGCDNVGDVTPVGLPYPLPRFPNAYAVPMGGGLPHRVRAVSTLNRLWLRLVGADAHDGPLGVHQVIRDGRRRALALQEGGVTLPVERQQVGAVEVVSAGSEIEEVPEPGSDHIEATPRDPAGDASESITGEGAGLFRHDPRGPLEAAGTLDGHVIRPAAIDCRDGQHDDQRRYRIEVAGRRDDQHWSMATLLAAARWRQQGPGNRTRRQARISQAVTLSRRSVRCAPTRRTRRRNFPCPPMGSEPLRPGARADDVDDHRHRRAEPDGRPR